MLRRSTKIQIILFVIITLVGISYVSAEYVGLAKNVFGGDQCTVSADFPESGGIFTNAEVTLRGVTIGRVGELHIIKRGVRVDLDIDNCSDPKIPKSTKAIVADRSVVGEQYVNLVPPNNKGPYISSSGYVIPLRRNDIPTSTKTLLVNLDRLINSVDLNNLRTTVAELNNAVRGRGDDLGSLLDSTDALLDTALEPSNVQNTLTLIDQGSTVLQTQLDSAEPLKIWTHSLNLLSQQLKKSDPDIRHLLNTGPSDLATVRDFIQTNRSDLGVVLANLADVGDVLVRHLDGIEQVLELYPALGAGGQTPLHDGVGDLGIVLQASPMPQDCGDPKQARQGYNGTRRSPSDLSPAAPDVTARCTAPASSGTNIRGSANVPGGDPISESGGDYAYPRVTTNNTVQSSTQGSTQGSTDTGVSTHLLQPSGLGDASWLRLLTDAVR